MTLSRENWYARLIYPRHIYSNYIRDKNIPDEVLAFMLNIDMSQDRYIQTRLETKIHNANIYSSSGNLYKPDRNVILMAIVVI